MQHPVDFNSARLENQMGIPALAVDSHSKVKRVENASHDSRKNNAFVEPL